VVRYWKWDEFDQKVEEAVAEIKKRPGVSSVIEDQKEATANDLLEAGVWASKEGDEVRAVAAFRVAVTLDPKCWKAFYNLGWQYLQIGNRLPRPFIGKVESAGGDSPPLASSSSAPGDKSTFYNNALRSLKRVLRMNIQYAKGWCLLGQTQYYLEKYDEAQASLRKAIDLDPSGEGGKMAAESLAVLEQSLKEHDV